MSDSNLVSEKCEKWIAEHANDNPIVRPFLYSYEVYGFLYFIENELIYKEIYQGKIRAWGGVGNNKSTYQKESDGLDKDMSFLEKYEFMARCHTDKNTWETVEWPKQFENYNERVPEDVDSREWKYREYIRENECTGNSIITSITKTVSTPKEIAEDIISTVIRNKSLPAKKTDSISFDSITEISKILDTVKTIWDNHCKEFKIPSNYGKKTKSKLAKGSLRGILTDMEISTELKPIVDFAKKKENLKNAVSENSNEQDLRNAYFGLKEAFITLISDLYQENEQTGQYFCLGRNESNALKTKYNAICREKAPAAAIQALSIHQLSPDNLITRAVESGFNFKHYVERLASDTYFDKLVDRAGFGRITIDNFIVRKLRREKQRQNCKLANLLDQEPRIKLFTARGGYGKTSSVIALVRAFSDSGSVLRRRLGFSNENDERLQNIPFFFSFNPGGGHTRPQLTEPINPDNSTGPAISRYDILENLFYHSSLPSGDELKKAINGLDNKAVFIIDALDEADNYSCAVNSISQLVKDFKSARFIVASRSLSEKPGFLDSFDDEFCFAEFTEDEKKVFVKNYLSLRNQGKTIPEEELNTYALKLVTGAYTSEIFDVPLFISAATSKATYDEGSNEFSEIFPGDIYKNTITALIDKMSSVIDSRVRSLSSTNRSLDKKIRARKLLNRLALVTFFKIKTKSSIDGLLGTICDTDVIIDKTTRGLEWDCIRELMPKLAEDFNFSDRNCSDPNVDLSFPEKEWCGEEANPWREYLISSGVVPCMPSDNGGLFTFENDAIHTYLAASGLADLFYENRQSEALKLLSKLLFSLTNDNAKDIARFIVMLLYCFNPNNPPNKEKDETISIGNSLQAMHYVSNGLKLKRGEQTIITEFKNAFEDILEEKFCESNLVEYEFKVGSLNKQIYHEMLVAELNMM